MNNFDILKREITECLIRAESKETIQVLNHLQEFADGLGDGWISVDDKLPPLEAVVLVYQRPLRYVLTAEYFVDRWEFSELMPHDTRVTHWRPLPKSPKE